MGRRKTAALKPQHYRCIGGPCTQLYLPMPKREGVAEKPPPDTIRFVGDGEYRRRFDPEQGSSFYEWHPVTPTDESPFVSRKPRPTRAVSDRHPVSILRGA